MNTAKTSTQTSLLLSLLNLFAVSLLTSVGVSLTLVGIVLLLSPVG